MKDSTKKRIIYIVCALSALLSIMGVSEYGEDDFTLVKELPDTEDFKMEDTDGEMRHFDLAIMLKDRKSVFGIPMSYSGTPKYVLYRHRGRTQTKNFSFDYASYIELSDEDVDILRELYPDIPETPTLSFWERIGGRLLIIFIVLILAFIILLQAYYIYYDYKKDKNKNQMKNLQDNVTIEGQGNPATISETVQKTVHSSLDNVVSQKMKETMSKEENPQIDSQSANIEAECESANKSDDSIQKQEITFMSCLKIATAQKNFRIKGRASRKEFWYTFIWSNIFATLAMIIFTFIDASMNLHLQRQGDLVIPLVICFIVCIPTIVAGIRRLHDIGKGGEYIFIGIIPYIGLILNYYWAQPSDEGDNKYGPQPK